MTMNQVLENSVCLKYQCRAFDNSGKSDKERILNYIFALFPR